MIYRKMDKIVYFEPKGYYSFFESNKEHFI